jgi:hypothetical protein
VYFAVLLIHFISADVILCLSCSLTGQVSHPYNKAGNAEVLYIVSLVRFCTSEGFKVPLVIPVTCRNYDILTVTSFSFCYETVKPIANCNWVTKCLFVL